MPQRYISRNKKSQRKKEPKEESTNQSKTRSKYPFYRRNKTTKRIHMSIKEVKDTVAMHFYSTYPRLKEEPRAFVSSTSVCVP